MVFGVELERDSLTPRRFPFGFPPSPPKLKAEPGPLCLVHGPPEPKTEKALLLLRDAACLSSGKLATLTGVTDYQELDSIHAGFVVWMLRQGDVGAERWESWVDAWREYAAGKFPR